MKPGFAVLPLEVWADVSEHPLLTRQTLAQIADNNGDPDFTNKLQKLLHGCGKHSMRYLDISSKPPDKPINKVTTIGGRGFINKFQKFMRDCGKQTLQYFGISSKPSEKTTQEPKIEPERRALLVAAPDFDGWVSFMHDGLPTTNECEFPQTDDEMPENIKTFKGLSIRHLDDEVLAFLNKIKPLFANVFLVIFSMQSALNDMRILFTHIIPMLGNIRGIGCDDIGIVEFLEQQFPGTLAQAKELDLFLPEPTSIPACLNWLSAPMDFNLHGPRFLTGYVRSDVIFAIVDAVRKHFLATTNQSAFVIFLQFKFTEEYHRAEELTVENATTNEELTVRNGNFKWLKEGIDIHYVEVLRHPTGADLKMKEWIKKRAFFEKRYNSDEIEANKIIRIDNPTIGRISNQAEDNSGNVQDDNADGASTSATRK